MNIGLIAGLVLVTIFVLLASRARDRGRRAFAIGLFIAAVVYFVFAIIGGANTSWLMLEAAGVAAFGILAWLGYRRSAAIIAFGWIVHVAWDLVLHLNGAGGAFTPDWYPWLCVSFDAGVAGAAMSITRKSVTVQ